MKVQRAIAGTDYHPLHKQVLLLIMVILPFASIALMADVSDAQELSLNAAISACALYVISYLGITVGYHRLFSHRSFRAARVARVCLAVAGTLAFQGPVIRWAADHRRHHAFSDRDGDPHSPWRFGDSLWAMTRGMLYAHVGWLFDYEETNQQVFVPDLLRDSDLTLISRYYVQLGLIGAFLPTITYVAISGSVQNGIYFFFWTAIIRVSLSQHVTWSINSLCHVFGKRPFVARDKSANIWLLAILSMGESWHNGHHALPYSARHGLLPWQIDVSARVIRGLELVGLASGVKWPSAADIEAARAVNGPRRAEQATSGG